MEEVAVEEEEEEVASPLRSPPKCKGEEELWVSGSGFGGCNSHGAEERTTAATEEYTTY